MGARASSGAGPSPRPGTPPSLTGMCEGAALGAATSESAGGGARPTAPGADVGLACDAQGADAAHAEAAAPRHRGRRPRGAPRRPRAHAHRQPRPPRPRPAARHRDEGRWARGRGAGRPRLARRRTGVRPGPRQGSPGAPHRAVGQGGRPSARLPGGLSWGQSRSVGPPGPRRDPRGGASDAGAQRRAHRVQVRRRRAQGASRHPENLPAHGPQDTRNHALPRRRAHRAGVDAAGPPADRDHAIPLRPSVARAIARGGGARRRTGTERKGGVGRPRGGGQAQVRTMGI